MADVVDVGLNFVRIKEEDGRLFTFQCGADVVKNDRVVEFAKKKALEAVEDYDFEAYVELFEAGWSLSKVETSEEEDEDEDEW